MANGTSKERVHVLLQALASGDNVERACAAKELGFKGENAVRAFPALIAALVDPFHEVRWNAANAIDQLCSETTAGVPELVKALTNEALLVRLGVVTALGKMGERAEAAVPALALALSDNAQTIQTQAAWALEQVGGKAEAAIPALTEALRTGEPLVKLNARRALERIERDLQIQVLSKGVKQVPRVARDRTTAKARR